MWLPLGTGFFKVWPWWSLRRFERPQLFHLNAEMAIKRDFGGSYVVTLYCRPILRDSWKNLRVLYGTSNRLKEHWLNTLNFVGTKNLVLNATGGHYGQYIFFTKTVCTCLFNKKEYVTVTAHMYSTETVINASRLINKFHYCYIWTVSSQYKRGNRLLKAANLLLKMAFSRFFHSKFVYDAGSASFRQKFMLYTSVS